jgi:hypothetical protein
MRASDLRSGVVCVRGLSFGLRVVVLSLCVCGVAAAQSGRRVTRGAQPGATPEPAPIIELKTEPVAKKPQRVLPNVPVLIAGKIDSKTQAERSQKIYNSFVHRLAESMTVNSLGLLKRDEALRRARDEPDSYLVWLELERDSVEGARVIFNSPNILVNFKIIDPRTGESKGKGRIYYQAQGGGGSRRSEPGEATVRITPEAAGEEAADQTLDWFAVLAVSLRKN